VESNIHFPTDINLLWDCARKSMDIIRISLTHYGISEWRKLEHWHKTTKRLYQKTANIHQRKGKAYKERLKRSTEKYLNKCSALKLKVTQSEEELLVFAGNDLKAMALFTALSYYRQMLEKHIDLVERRIIKGEVIPHQEKIFSIFEPHVEWISKGKHHKPVELGHNALISTDQFHFIVDHEVVFKQSDKALVIPLADRLKQKFAANYLLYSISFDRGFYSLLARKYAEKIFEIVVMPKSGKKSIKQQEVESEKSFVQLRKEHSAVESNINELEYSGLNRVPDKGKNGFVGYVAWGVLAHNLKRLGKIVLEENIADIKVKAKPKRHLSKAA